MKSKFRLALLLSSLCLVAIPARADLAPSEPAPCEGKQVGMACRYNGAAGTCQNDTCHRYDYNHWNHDAGGPPWSAYDCVICATASSRPTTDGGDSPTTGDGGCTIGQASGTRRVAPWLLAATFSSLFLIARRRRS
jgi:hypothetical protein